MESVDVIDKPTRQQLEKEIRDLKEELSKLNLKMKPIFEKLRSEVLTKDQQWDLLDQLEELTQEMDDIRTEIAFLQDELEPDTEEED